MGSKANSLRKKWQDYSGKNAGIAEKNFYEVFNTVFMGSEFRIRAKPKEFNKIYTGVELDEQVLSEIYTPDKPIKKHGVFPDFAIDYIQVIIGRKCIFTKKTIYIEIKRQNGWVEGGKRSDGRGNAHERSCKFFAPGLIKILRKKGNLKEDVLPFWTIFQGDITRDPCRVREITCWYDGYPGHFFLWRDTNKPDELFDHFEEHIAPLLF